MEERQKRVLVIDDEEAIRRYLRYLLEKRGFGVVVCGDGEEGVRVFARERFDIVFTDIAMPRKDGVEAILEMKRGATDTRFVAISGGDPGGRLLEVAGKLGADATLMKPFTQGDIDRVVGYDTGEGRVSGARSAGLPGVAWRRE
jgi:DNA-binding response OmpR family regulator